MAAKFANVIVDITHEKLDKTFQYIIPKDIEQNIAPGVQVLVPFGKGNRQIKAYVIEVTDKPEYDISKMKYIDCIVPSSVPIESQLICVAAWIKENYGSTMSSALKVVIPVSQTVKGKTKESVSLNVSENEVNDLIEKYNSDKRMSKRIQLLGLLLNNKTMDVDVLVNEYNISKNVIKTMDNLDVIITKSDAVYRLPYKDINVATQKEIELNDSQKKVVNDIVKEMEDENGKRTHLIFGVTGSGKTEVYMECIDSVIKKGKQVIMLIPEIALTYQNLNRFYTRYGNKVSVINSRMSKGERYDQFMLAEEGQVNIMIGPRSALFTPFKNLGLIIIDEEHENAYKSEKAPKYHARETAIMRANLTDATVILGSATPSVEAFHRAKKGEYLLHTLDRRANERPMPKVHVIDLREELESGNRGIFSYKLLELIKDRLEKKQQIILFVNRRGYAGFVSCRSCGKPIRCPHCDVSLTYHKRYGKEVLSCHYCGYTIDKPANCPKCGSKYLGRFGIGTESVEEKVSLLFPNARVLRMDMDTTSGKGGHEKILSEFSKGNADILVGTQMIVKGHDFPGVTLVGVIAADLSLFASDYRATERTFQLLTQAAGRAGRGNESGEVVIQTYSPDEPCIQAASKQDYVEFYNQEITFRSMMKYPPTYNMVAILISGADSELCENAAKDIANRIRKSNVEGLYTIGATQASISKINDIYRYVIYMKHENYDKLVYVKNAIERYIDKFSIYKKSISVQFDFTPMDNY